MWCQESGPCRLEKGQQFSCFVWSRGSNEVLIFFQSVCLLTPLNLLLRCYSNPYMGLFTYQDCNGRSIPLNNSEGTQQKSFMCGSIVKLYGEIQPGSYSAKATASKDIGEARRQRSTTCCLPSSFQIIATPWPPGLFPRRRIWGQLSQALVTAPPHPFLLRRHRQCLQWWTALLLNYLCSL